MNNKIDATALYNKMQEGSKESLILPPPSFSMMQCEIIDYQETEKSIVVKIPVLKEWIMNIHT